jgi:hypothetical protein
MLVCSRRLTAPVPWSDEAEQAVDREGLAGRLVLSWPATAGDRDLGQLQVAPDETLRGETLRGPCDQFAATLVSMLV